MRFRMSDFRKKIKALTIIALHFLGERAACLGAASAAVELTHRRRAAARRVLVAAQRQNLEENCLLSRSTKQRNAHINQCT